MQSGDFGAGLYGSGLYGKGDALSRAITTSTRVHPQGIDKGGRSPTKHYGKTPFHIKQRLAKRDPLKRQLVSF